MNKNLKDLVAVTGIFSGFIALAIGVKEVDKINGGIELLTTYALESKTVFDRNRDGIPDYVRITTLANRVPVTYFRELTSDELNQYYKQK